jgi:hypothetical protein
MAGIFQHAQGDLLGPTPGADDERAARGNTLAMAVSQ